MKRFNSMLLILSLLGASLLGAFAQDASKLNATLLKATAPYEDMVEPALAKNDKTVAKFLADADKDADAVKKVLPDAAVKQFDSLLQTMHTAADRKNDYAVAQTAMMIFRLLVDNLKADALKIPLEVSLLDYAGYQMEVLAASEPPDWDAMSKLAAQADGWWKAIAKKITDKNLRAAVNSTMGGMKQSTAEKNLSQAKFAARIDLDLVDLLEGAFKK